MDLALAERPFVFAVSVISNDLNLARRMADDRIQFGFFLNIRRWMAVTGGSSVREGGVLPRHVVSKIGSVGVEKRQ